MEVLQSSGSCNVFTSANKWHVENDRSRERAFSLVGWLFRASTAALIPDLGLSTAE